MALVYLYPVADFSVGGSIGSTTGSPHYRAVDEPYNAPNDSDEVFSTATSDGGGGQIVYTLQALPPVIKVNKVTLVYRARRELGSGGTGIKAAGFVHIGGVQYRDTIWTPPDAYATSARRKEYLTNPATSANWQVADFASAAVRAGMEGWDDTSTFNSVLHSQLYLELDVVLAPTALGFMRDRLSREMRIITRPSQVIELGPPIDVLGGYEPLTDVALSHVGLPPAGAGVKRWQRRLLTVLSATVDLDEQRQEITGLDLRRFRVSDLDSCYSTEDEPSPLAQGVLRLSQGQRTFTRTSKAWVPSPLDGRILELGQEDEQLSRDGLLLLAARKNYVPYSSFVGGTTGWTLSGTGSNGSAIAQDSGVLYFDTSVVPGGALKITSGNPLHAADLYAASGNSDSITASTVVVAWFAHLDQGGTLAWQLQRVVDSWYWNDTSGAWQAGAVWNALPQRTAWAVDRSKAINVGGSNTRINLKVGRPVSGGVAGQVNWLGHAQVEDAAYPSRPIVTTGPSAVTRNRDVLTLTCNHGQRTWPLGPHTGRMILKPLWSDADITGATKVLLALTLDASNSQRVFFTQGSGWAFRRRYAGVNYDAIVPGTPVAGTTYKLAWRVTGPEGELGLAPYTLSIWVDGVKGTDAVAAGQFVGAPSLLTLQVGHLTSPAGFEADCAYLWREIVPFVLDDDEAVDF